MKLTRRNLFAAGGTAALAGGLAACGSDSGGGSGGGSGDNELSVLTPIFADAEGTQVFEETIGGSFEGNLQLSVDYTPWDRLNEKISTGVAGGLTSDILMSGVGWVPPFAHMGVFGELPEGILDELDIHEKLLETCRYEGTLYGLPYLMDGRMLVANNALLDERGITELPSTLEEFREMLREMQGDDIQVPLDLFTNDIRQTWVHLIGAFGGSLFSDDGSAVAFDDGSGEAALQYMIDLIDDGSTSFDVRQAEGQPTPFQQSSVIFQLGNTSMWRALSDESPDMITEEAMEIFLVPGGEGNDPSLFLGGTLVSMGANAGDPELAQQFIRHLYTPENLGEAAAYDGQVPAVNAMPEQETIDSNRLLNFVSDNLDYANAFEGGSPAWMEIRANVNPELEAAVTGDKSPADTIASLKQIADEAFTRL